jgi:CNT family concentrative nucleoside transporter
MTETNDLKMQQPPMEEAGLKNNLTSVVPKANPPKNLNSLTSIGTDVALAMALTAWLIVAWIRNPGRMGLPAFIYFCIIAKLATKRVSNATLIAPFAKVFGLVLSPFQHLSNFIIGAGLMGLALLIAVLAILIIPDSTSTSRTDRLRSLGGLIVIILTMFLTSKVCIYRNPIEIITSLIPSFKSVSLSNVVAEYF